jgi:hypothetical protein
MRICKLRIVALAVGAALSVAGQALAQSPPTAALTGARLKDAKGAAAGQIEKVIADGDGRPRQVLVRVGRILRVLPIDALTPGGDGYATVLTRAELDALPAAE